ncbi:MAG TPA: hypothetical protein VM802_31285 [Chitinophaga sp.]|uniref:hypothetical protein n=1 Tax=Chitinophaga sp. TaxID=1869181 RepID=UPI002BDA8567|nr:hypothetical protein [Chitinophaga sp.]HVI49391.1 hypothetical protein [Chitinophaga sp.]
MVLEQYIQRIEEKLQLLVKKHLQLQAENASLKEEVITQQETLLQQQQVIHGLEEKLQLSKLAAAAGGGVAIAEENEAFRKEVRSRINDYIKEIDRCIALLNG